MHQLKHIILVGLPGAGKSTIGRQLARRRELPFFDSDAVIEERLGEPIRSFFEREGEAAFRNVEEETLHALMAREQPCVLATGGGAVLRDANRQRMRERGVVVYLRAQPEQLIKRLRRDTRRPLLQTDNPLARLRALHAVREPLYREVATFTLDTCHLSASLLASKVAMQLDLAGVPGSAVF